MSRKFYCFALFIVMILSITCVAASEDVNPDTDALANIEEVDVQSTPIEDITADLSTTSNDEIISNESDTDAELDPNLNIDIKTNNEFVEIISTVNENATGNVSIQVKEINEENYTDFGSIALENGSATWSEFIAFEKGNYTVNVTYSGDNNYFSTSVLKEFVIEKYIPDFNVNVSTDNEFVEIATSINENATGTVTFRIKTYEEENYTEYATIELENGTATWADMIPFDKGDYVAYVTYNGDENYFNESSTQTFTIEKSITDLNVTITVNDCFIELNATVEPNATGTVTINVKNSEEENYTEYATVELENGTATWADMIPFDKGDYVAYTTYSGDDYYFKISDTQTFTIEKSVTDLNVTVTVDKCFITVNATVNENATGNVTIKIRSTEEENYTEYATVELENGTATWADMVSFDKGDYVIESIYNGDENYFDESNTQTFTIEKQLPEMLVNTTVVSESNRTIAIINITLPENATGIVSIINNMTGEVNNVTLNGTSILFNATLLAGDNIFIIQYSGDDYYFDTETTFDEINQLYTYLITPTKIKVRYGDDVSVVVELYQMIGEWSSPVENAEVCIIVNNETYNGTINHGVATINFTAKLVPDKYIVNVVFEGTDHLKNASANFTLGVKKIKTKLKANDAKYSVSTKTKKYKIRLTNSLGKKMKNKKVYLKVNGKTYKTTTDSKGKATFKITNLKKQAKFIALIKYKGSSYYKPVEKKVKLTVSY